MDKFVQCPSMQIPILIWRQCIQVRFELNVQVINSIVNLILI